MPARKKASPETEEKVTQTLTIDMNEQTTKMLQAAAERGPEHVFLFLTTLKRYRSMIAQLQELEKFINEEKTLTEKEYVKGRGNLYVNPAVKEYRLTSAQADKTAMVLMNIIREPLKNGDVEQDDLMMFLKS